MSIARQNIHFLEQALDLLARIDDTRFTAVAQRGQGSIGAHLRHVLDYYGCFLAGLDEGRVDYDQRCRDRTVESDRRAATATLAGIVERLGALGTDAFDRPLSIRVDAAAWREEGGGARSAASTVGRELQFLLSHTVHHYALVAMLLRLQGFEPGDAFGVAPSTLEHRRVISPAGTPAAG